MNELADIIEPAPPLTDITASSGWLVSIAIAIVLVVVFVVWWRRTAERRRALRRVRQLRRDVARGRLGARELAYNVAGELRAVLRTPRLRANAAPVAESPEQQQTWRELVERLDTLRYRPGAQLDATQLDALLRDSTLWLTRER